MINFVFYALLTSFFLSCSGNTSEKKTDQQTGKNAETRILVKPPATYADTLIISSASAVFYHPDSIQLEKIKSTYKKDFFENMVHENFYQMRNARNVLIKYWPNIEIIETSSARFLLFVKADKSKVCIDLNTEGDMNGIFLFDQKKDPELIDMMNVDTALGFYFKK